MKRLAVLLTVYNRKQKTLECLSGLFAQSIPESVTMTVYLTDDGCTDGTPESVSEQFPQVKIIHGDGSLYWNRGMNTAWSAASDSDYDWYLWLNDDTILLEGAIPMLLDEITNVQDGTIIVGATKEHGSVILTYGGRLKNGRIPDCDGVCREIDFFNGNIVLVDREAYRRVGLLDNYYTHSRGDFDYGHRAKSLGIRLLQYGTVLGECDAHPVADRWCNPDIPLRKRLAALKQPTGMPLNELFYYESKYNNMWVALFHCMTTIIHCLFPKIWKHKQ